MPKSECHPIDSVQRLEFVQIDALQSCPGFPKAIDQVSPQLLHSFEICRAEDVLQVGPAFDLYITIHISNFFYSAIDRARTATNLVSSGPAIRLIMRKYIWVKLNCNDCLLWWMNGDPHR